MSALYQNLINIRSNESSTPKSVDARRKSISLPVTQYIGRLTQDRKKKQRKSVKFPSTVLMQQAIMDGDVQEMKQLISEHGSQVVSEPEPSGLPPVMRCVFEGQLAPLRLLVEVGADVAARDSENWTALHVAATMDDEEAAKLILNNCKQCLTQVRNVDGERPIDLAESTDMARLLLEADLKAFQTCDVEDTAAAESEDAILALVREHFKKNGDTQALNVIMQNSTSYDSLLHMAASKNYPRLAAYLLSHRLCELEARDRRGWTVLHTAAYYNSLDVTLLLVQNGASIHSLANSTYEKASDLTNHALIHSLLQEEYL